MSKKRRRPVHWWGGDAVLFTVCSAIVLAAAILTPSTEALSFFGVEVPVLCGFRAMSGMPCPGCGLTRSFTFMAHFQFVEAFRMNLFGPPFFLFVAGQVPYRGWLLVGELRKRWNR